MASYTVNFYKLSITGERGDLLESLSGEFDSEQDALESLNEQFRQTYTKSFYSEIQV